jgi:hypothetical protein
LILKNVVRKHICNTNLDRGLAPEKVCPSKEGIIFLLKNMNVNNPPLENIRPSCEYERE